MTRRPGHAAAVRTAPERTGDGEEQLGDAWPPSRRNTDSTEKSLGIGHRAGGRRAEQRGFNGTALYAAVTKEDEESLAEDLVAEGEEAKVEFQEEPSPV